MRQEQLGAALDLLPEHRLLVVEAAGQARILVADPGQQEGHAAAARRRFRGAGGPDPLRISRPQRRRGLLARRRQHRAAVRERPPAHPQGVGGVGEAQVRILFQAIGEAVRHPFQGGGRARREQQHLPGARRI